MVGNSPTEFWSEPKKWANEQFVQKVSDSLICSFLVSNLCDLLTSPHSFFFFNCKKTYKNTILFEFFWAKARFCEQKSECAIHSKKQDIRSFAHLSWVTWANCSHLLICHERPERFAHSRSFVLSNLSESLTFAHLSWAIWAHERMCDEQMSKFPTLQVCLRICT